MPIATSQPVYPPYEGQPIDTAWGKAVSEGVIQNFPTVADRTARWTTPPDGSLSAVHNALHARISGSWSVHSLYTQYQFFSGGGGNGQVGTLQLIDTLIKLQPCPYPCVMRAVSDTIMWSGGPGAVDFFNYTNDIASPQGYGYSSRCAIWWQMGAGQYLGMGTILISGKGHGAGSHYNEGDVPELYMRHNYTTGSLGFQGHAVVVYLPVSVQTAPVATAVTEFVPTPRMPMPVSGAVTS